MLKISLLVFTAGLLLSCHPAQAGPFDRGAMRINLLFSRANAFDHNYSVYGIGFGYYVLNGLELGLSYETWQGGPLDIDQVTPELRYVFRNKSTLQPYTGMFFRRTYISQLEDLDAYGFRLGVFFNTGQRVIFGLGAVYSKYRNCNVQLVSSCDDTYPELSVAFGI